VWKKMETLLAFQNSLEQLQFTKAAKILQCSLREELTASSVSFLFAPLLLLTSCECVYYSLSFLESKSSKTQENQLQIIYSEVTSNFNQVSAVLDTVVMNEPNQDKPELRQARFLTHLIKHLRIIIVARRKMVGIYCELQNRNECISYGPLIEPLISIKSQLERDVDHPLMAQLRDNIITEIELLIKLFSTQRYIANFKFKDSLFHIYQCKCEFEALEHKFLCIDTSMADPLQYNLFRFFKTFLAILTAKSCFYYRRSLFPRGDKEIQKIRPELDYHSMVVNFVEQTKCFSFCLVLNMSQKYSVGTQAWPKLYFYPERETQGVDSHWPNIVSVIQDFKKYLSNFRNRPYYIYDTKVNTTYFIAKVERLMFAVTIFLGKKERDDPIINLFLDKLVHGLRSWNLFELTFS